MNARAKNLVKVAVFGGFIALSSFVGSSLMLYPPTPTRVGDDPYSVSLKQMNDYQVLLEGQPVVIISWISDFRVNGTSGDMEFAVSQGFFNITEQVLFKAWAPGGVQSPGPVIGNGSHVVLKGICKIHSEGLIEGTEIHVIQQDNVYMVSVSGLIAIVAMLFVYFRLDIKRLGFQAKGEPGEGTEAGGA